MSEFRRGRHRVATGAAGPVGDWLVRCLAEAGADVVCLVRGRVPQSELVRTAPVHRVKTVHFKVRALAFLYRVLAGYKIDIVIKLAAQTIAGIANRSPVSTFQTNVQGMWALLEACRRSDLKPEVQNMAPHEIRHQYLLASRAREMPGWKPLFTLGEGLQRTIGWHRDFMQETA
jgi:CDP-glucose 4,6-dehydratase